MKYADRKKLMEEQEEQMKALNPEQLAGGKTPANLAEGYFRSYVLYTLDTCCKLLGDIADSQGSMAFAYQEMLKLQQQKKRPQSDVAPPLAAPATVNSRYGGPKA
jgi:hypothetical protein